MTPGRGTGSRAVIVGGGIIGLCCATALTNRGWRVTIVSERRLGEASPAAGGILGPAVEAVTGAAHEFGIAARDLYPGFLHELHESTGIRVPLLRNGILQVAASEGEALELQLHIPAGSRWLTAEDLRAMEPALSPAIGALYHPHDGAVDNVILLDAMRQGLMASRTVDFVHSAAKELPTNARSSAIAVRSLNGLHEGDIVVLAAGAWSPELSLLPGPLAVTPVRGQMLSVAARPLSRVVYGSSGYIVPRGSASVLGSTMESVGFEAGTTEDGIAAIATAARLLCPSVKAARELARWSGLRPITPDLSPIICQDPEKPSLLYACGHSRNGILLAPLTGECIAALASGDVVRCDLSPFSVQRFRSENPF